MGPEAEYKEDKTLIYFSPILFPALITVLIECS